ncbi:putative DNA mismatch repair protein Msh6 [Xylona heveae TC161]|uniref:DNA mismatch repair protein n=1 Tax=Xylona heveae (strain CBS 132557 / TC161) TaxID=1328760 RepID=A0A165JHL1_XYLHT|nr:putative DNA mismatch repair protein Msh6 [Xylona heveae TC161]KZF26251.1 putative DNA mismatch repair protein Msh6 [Xylona heveae TC161]
MARGKSSGDAPTTPNPPSLRKSSSASQPAKNQRSILGFFQKKSDTSPAVKASAVESGLPSSPLQPASSRRSNGHFTKIPVPSSDSSQSLTPAPSSDALEMSSPPRLSTLDEKQEDEETGLPSPTTPSEAKTNGKPVQNGVKVGASLGSPGRKSRKSINYAESDDEYSDEDEVFKPTRANATRSRSSKRRKLSLDDSDDEFVQDAAVDEADMDDIENFIVPDDSDEEITGPKKRKRASTAKASRVSPALAVEAEDDDETFDQPSASSAQQWTYDPENLKPLNPRPVNTAGTRPNAIANKKHKEKAHTTEPEQRYPWLANITDADRNPPSHPDYDPRTIYIPPLAWAKFSPFEKQYWEIKQKFWDTIVFFKKGKFYELYENDATVGHQLFDLKLTDRVNMRMVGVPEMSLDHWASQFVAKGYKIARVDQAESALGKEMRERDIKKPAGKAKEDKVIRRELACVLTAGTLVDGGMLQDDMSTFCVSIKESTVDDVPAFGISFVDTATGQFFLTEFIDDIEMTKFETFVAQIRPQEIILEKSSVSVKVLRILKNNTGPTTIWNYLKPITEFWTGETAYREINAARYFVSEDRDDEEVWPQALKEAKGKELLMSAYGALIQYLRTLKIERELVTLGNISWYDPIRKATSLVLDGQTLINLEIFANSFDGGQEGTLFTMLNRCITPFGKRMFRQWVCHPLADAKRINARLDAVDALNADTTIRDRFTSQLTKLPDLERLISRIHAGRCKAQDFVRTLEGFEQIEYTCSLFDTVGTGEGVIGQLLAAMPDLAGALNHWKTAFNRIKAKEEGLFVPERGVEEDFDTSHDRIEQIQGMLESLLKQARRDFKSNAIVFRDIGKEIYQLEVPASIKGIPRNWDQMSATSKVKRYYSAELRSLVRQLQEAQETHSQIGKEVAGRFFERFDEDYAVWLGAVKIIAQLDCLISLAKASYALGEPSCRPEFVDEDRSVLEFTELRHPCMLPNVTDFIPNDVRLGGETANINLLTGANAAGKSTILRMTCIAVIMAQIGCYVPCISARLTPVDRIMSRLGANDNIFAAQSTFFVELSETKKILSEATPRSLVILDELGRGTSSYDGVAVAQAVLHHIATHIGCTGFFATHYHSLATEFAGHPEIAPKRMQIHVDDENRRVTFLYKLEDGVAEGSFGMHCAAMCGISNRVIDTAEKAAKEWEHTSRLKESLEKARSGCYVPLGVQSDIAWMLREKSEEVDERSLDVLLKAIATL